MKSIFTILSLVLLCVGCSDKADFRSDTPLPRAAVGTEVNFPLPASAHDIYYLFFAGGTQDLEEYVRFDVSPQEVESTVDALIGDNNKSLSRTLPYLKIPLSAAPVASPRKEFLPMPWWNPSTIRRGCFRGENSSYALQIWVDQDASRIYVYQND